MEEWSKFFWKDFTIFRVSDYTGVIYLLNEPVEADGDAAAAAAAAGVVVVVAGTFVVEEWFSKGLDNCLRYKGWSFWCSIWASVFGDDVVDFLTGGAGETARFSGAGEGSLDFVVEWLTLVVNEFFRWLSTEVFRRFEVDLLVETLSGIGFETGEWLLVDRKPFVSFSVRKSLIVLFLDTLDNPVVAAVVVDIVAVGL